MPLARGMGVWDSGAGVGPSGARPHAARAGEEQYLESAPASAFGELRVVGYPFRQRASAVLQLAQ